MRVLIVESNQGLGGVWKNHLERLGAEVYLEADEQGAMIFLSEHPVDIMVLNLDMEGGGGLSLADYAAYRRPNTKVVFVTASSFFSDGSVFAHATNACACLPAQTAPDDLAATVEYHGRFEQAGAK